MKSPAPEAVSQGIDTAESTPEAEQRSQKSFFLEEKFVFVKYWTVT